MYAQQPRWLLLFRKQTIQYRDGVRTEQFRVSDHRRMDLTISGSSSGLFHLFSDVSDGIGRMDLDRLSSSTSEQEAAYVLTKAANRYVQKEGIHRISRVHQRIGGEKDRVGIIVSNDLIGEHGKAQAIGQ